MGLCHSYCIEWTMFEPLGIYERQNIYEKFGHSLVQHTPRLEERDDGGSSTADLYVWHFINWLGLSDPRRQSVVRM